MTDDRKPWEGIESPEPCVAALGLFDGVHIGHRAILSKTCERSAEAGLPSLVLSFRNHPQTVLSPPGKPPPRLLVTPERRAELIREMGINQVLLPEFTREWSQTRAESFAADFLVNYLKVRHVVIGFNYCFGRKAEGRAEQMEEFGERFGFGVGVVEPVKAGDGDVSSTRIRDHLLAGEIQEAALLLGQPHELSGVVIPGDGRGKALGYPTANIEPDLAPLIPEGVYAVNVLMERTGAKAVRLAPGMFFLGPRKTFGETDQDRTAEVHLIDYEGDLYGKRLRLEFLGRTRGAMKFDGPEKLVEQLGKDREDCEVLFGRRI